MKRIYPFIIMACSWLFISCEDVIEVDLTTAEPKLVVEASINWYKGTDGAVQEIRLSQTAGYFEESTPTIDEAIVQVIGPNSTLFTFESIGDGIYRCSDFVPELEGSYQLQILWNNQEYVATERLVPVVSIATIEQNAEGGFLGDQYEVRMRFLDPANTANYYLTRFDVSSSTLPDLSALADTFFDGNYGFSSYSDEDLQPGDDLILQLYGISAPYYDYMRKILAIAGSAGGSPFSTPPATVRGNIRNTSDASELILGYFRLSEVDRIEYTVSN